jgi:hypothetical protein
LRRNNGRIFENILRTGTIVTFYGGEFKNKVEIFTCFGSEFAPAGPSVSAHSPRHTIDCGMLQPSASL